MIIYNHLSVLIRIDLKPLTVVSAVFLERVYVHDLSIPLVFEQKALFIVGFYLD